jgi:hypothetical protein
MKRKPLCARCGFKGSAKNPLRRRALWKGMDRRYHLNTCRPCWRLRGEALDRAMARWLKMEE